MTVLTWDVEGCFPPTAYVPNAHTKGLWHLEANSNDSSGNGKHGTDTNIAYAAAKIGNGAHWTVGNGGISIPVNTMGTLGVGDFAMACWFYGANPGAGNFPVLHGSYDVSPYKGPVVYFDPLGVLTANDGISFQVDPANRHRVTTPSASSLYGKYTFIVFTRISGVCYVYYNDALVLSFADATNIPAAATAYINGINTSATVSWKSGLIGDEYIWEDQGWTLPMVQEAYGWRSVKTDAKNVVTAQHGYTGNNPTDRIAGPGSLQMTLNNAPDNTGAAEGYYSPGHASCRPGFDLGALFRLKISDGTTTKYQLRSKAKKITPVPGVHGSHETPVMCSDYFDDLSEAPLRQIAVLAGKRIDEAITAVLAGMAHAPRHTSFAVGLETYTHLLTGMSDNKSAPLTALQRSCQTDLSYLFLVGDGTDGETLKWDNRHSRLSAVSEATFADTMSGVVVQRDRAKLINDVTTVAHPPKLDTVAVILAKTDDLEFTLEPGATNAKTMTLAFTDPDMQGRRVDMVAGSQPVGWPVAGTDYKMGSTSGGSDLNANLVITPVWGANTIQVTFANTAAVRGYVSIFHARGIGIYDNTPVEKNSQDADSIDTHGSHPARYDVPYSDSESFVKDLGKVLLANNKDPRNYIKSVTFHAHDPNNHLFATYAATLDVGSMITVAETVTGIVGDYFVGSIKWECREGNSIDVTLGELEPAIGNWSFRLCAAADDVTDPAISILALYPESDTVNFTPTDPYGNPFHRLYI